MKKKKLHFFNLAWRKYSKWQQILIALLIISIYLGIRYFIEDTTIDTIFGMVFWVGFYGYLFYPFLLKNTFHYGRDENFTLKIKGEKLDLNLKFLSEVWIENNELHIRRINRVDSFDISHLREEDVEKLVSLLKEYEPQEA